MTSATVSNIKDKRLSMGQLVAICVTHFIHVIRSPIDFVSPIIAIGEVTMKIRSHVVRAQLFPRPIL